MFSFQLQVYLNALLNYFMMTLFMAEIVISLKYYLKELNSSTNHLDCTWRNDMRSWQD